MPLRKPLAQVAVPLGLRRVFSYRVPPALRETLQVGHRVRIPFGPRRAHGYVVGFTSEVPGAKLRAITAIEPAEVVFTPEILRLTRWVADYYLTPWGQALEAALPPGVRHGGAPVPKRARRVSEVAGDDADSAAEGPDGGLVASAWPAGAGPETPHVLQAEQRVAVASVAEALATRRFASLLLLGVTGSGKTEVYLDAAERVVAEGGSVLLLVPEIAMGTQILSRVLRRFGGRAGLYHSQTGDAERRRVWNEARAGRLPVVVGTRSAVFVPLPNLRLVVVDEEHESAYKQDETPRYHGRDTAVMRARLAEAVVVLGSATPSLESLYNAESGKYRLLRLRERIDSRPHARVTLVDLNEARGGDPPERGRPRPVKLPAPVLSPPLLRALQERLDRKEQSILFLNRRGHSTVVQCAACGEALCCAHCDVVMTYHKPDGVIRCHYCSASRDVPAACPSCRGERFLYHGVGTQKVEEMLAEAFPAARVARLDLDAVRPRGAHGRVISAMERCEVDILLGTQMVAKGFHFPRVTLVGVLQADREMLQPDFRAGERAFQVLTQVAGRSGRSETAGEVVFQSLMPGHPVITAAVNGDYDGFASRELELRRALGYPPYRRMTDLLVDGKDADQVRRRAEALRELLAACEGVEVLGPAPMPHARLKGRHRWHLTMRGRSVEKLHAAALVALEAAAPAGLTMTRLMVDVDPVGMS
jgi:primosomal protein N' (replication factor Y) (superfamily II helicase)